MQQYGANIKVKSKIRRGNYLWGGSDSWFKHALMHHLANTGSVANFPAG